MIPTFKEPPYEFLSNFAYVPVEYDGRVYKSVEHAYQAAKTVNENERERIQLSRTPGEAKRLGKVVTMRPDWNQVRVAIMKELLVSKFSQEPFKTKLLKTGDETLVEGNWWHDNFWGACSCGGCYRRTKTNTLGVLLMEVRKELRE